MSNFHFDFAGWQLAVASPQKKTKLFVGIVATPILSDNLDI